MTVVCCVDDAYGMEFNFRRQSQDSRLRQRLLQLAEGKTLRMNGYSAAQFPEQKNILVSENFLAMARDNDICFMECCDPGEGLSACDRLILYCWNRKYPADRRFPAERLKEFELVSTADFVGTSHDTITERIYEKK